MEMELKRQNSFALQQEDNLKLSGDISGCLAPILLGWVKLWMFAMGNLIDTRIIRSAHTHDSGETDRSKSRCLVRHSKRNCRSQNKIIYRKSQYRSSHLLLRGVTFKSYPALLVSQYEVAFSTSSSNTREMCLFAGVVRCDLNGANSYHRSTKVGEQNMYTV